MTELIELSSVGIGGGVLGWLMSIMSMKAGLISREDCREMQSKCVSNLASRLDAIDRRLERIEDHIMESK